MAVFGANAFCRRVAFSENASQAAQENSVDTAGKQTHQIGDILRKVNGFVFLTCMCGIKLKVPPNYKPDKVRCPRCKKIVDIPNK